MSVTKKVILWCPCLPREIYRTNLCRLFPDLPLSKFPTNAFQEASGWKWSRCWRLERRQSAGNCFVLKKKRFWVSPPFITLMVRKYLEKKKKKTSHNPKSCAYCVFCSPQVGAWIKRSCWGWSGARFKYNLVLCSKWPAAMKGGRISWI